jgi:hypothetical protein
VGRALGDTDAVEDHEVASVRVGDAVHEKDTRAEALPVGVADPCASSGAHSAGRPPVARRLGDDKAEGAEEADGEPVEDVVPVRDSRAVSVPVGGGEGGTGEGRVFGRHAAEEVAPRYSVLRESQGVGSKMPLEQK